MGRKSKTSRYREIAKEHAAIHEVMRKIATGLDRLHAHPAKPGEPWGLPRLVRSFREHLVRHFTLEEEGGLLGAAAQYYEGEAQHTVRQLVAEHRGFERRIDQILSELHGDFVPPEIVQICFVRDLRKLITDLARHERIENELLENLFSQG